MARGQWLVPWIFWPVMVICAPEAAAQVQIGGLSDLQLGTWSGFGDLEGMVDHCVRGPQGGRFAVVATGDGPGGAFVLQNGPVSLPYLVDYDDGGGWSQLDPVVPLAGQRGAPNQNQFQRCLNGQQSGERVRVRVLAQDLGVAAAGIYAGSLSLLITPE